MKTKILSLLAVGCLLVAGAFFVQRVDEAQAEPVPQKYREMIRKGLDYLAAKQLPDGHWEGDDGAHPVAMTGLAGIALLMEKDEAARAVDRTAGESKRSANIRKAADWLIAKSRADRDGLIFSEHPSETSRYMQGHGLATIFLVGVWKEEIDEAREKKLTELLVQAMKYIESAQSSQGGWHDTSRVEGHDFASVPATVIQLQALQALRYAGISFPPAVIHDGHEYLKAALARQEKADPKAPGRIADIAAALGCNNLGREGKRDDTVPMKWLEGCRAKLPGGRDLRLGRDELAHYYFAQAEYALESAAWPTYRTAMFDQLLSTQNKDGSWPAGDGLGKGTVYSTAIWCTVLQLDGNSHPSMHRVERATK